jgi:hypothetical protein
MRRQEEKLVQSLLKEQGEEDKFKILKKGTLKHLCLGHRKSLKNSKNFWSIKKPTVF